MRYICLLAIWFISLSGNPVNYARPVFGVKISVGPNSSLTSYVCLLDNGRVLTKRKNVDASTFVKIVSGYWPSIYNPKRINYFEENNIDCSIIIDSITQKQMASCVPLDSLWKIRYSTYPYRGNTEMGWSNKYHRPSLGQEKYLYDRYNVKQIDGDYFLDTNFWRLIQDVNDTNWISNYKSIH